MDYKLHNGMPNMRINCQFRKSDYHHDPESGSCEWFESEKAGVNVLYWT